MGLGVLARGYSRLFVTTKTKYSRNRRFIFGWFKPTVTMNKGEGSSEAPEESGSGAGSHQDDTPEETEESIASGIASMDLLKQMFAKFSMGAEEQPEEPEPPEQLLPELTPKGVAEYILSDKCNNIILMTGAGISTAAGIPDFRSPGSGLYDNLQKYNLPTPQSIFDIEFFKENPKPFYTLAKELYPGNFQPTKSHYFIKLLEEKGVLLRAYTQNIDTLERVAGISGEKLVEAHGTFHSAHCVECKKEFTQEWVKEQIFKDEIPLCSAGDCSGNFVKPDIVFFGEALPQRFHKCRTEDFPVCDLLIIMGTSLKVQPFASLTGSVTEITPRLLINREKCGLKTQNDMMMVMMGFIDSGLDFDSDKAYRDVALLGDCDAGCEELAKLLGWEEDFKRIIETRNKELEDGQGSY